MGVGAGGPVGAGGGQQPVQQPQTVDRSTATQNIQLTFSGPQNETNFLTAVFLALLTSVGVTQKLAQSAADVVNANAEKQSAANKEIMSLRFQELPTMASGLSSNARTDIINRNNQYNQNVQFRRQNIQQVIVTLQQSGKGAMSDAQVTVNYLQQNTSETSAVLKVMITIFQLISNMTSPNQ